VPVDSVVRFGEPAEEILREAEAFGADLIAVTTAEIRRLLTAFTHPQHPGEHYQHWSRWRRHHQAQARQSHYQRRLTNQSLPMTC